MLRIHVISLVVSAAVLPASVPARTLADDDARTWWLGIVTRPVDPPLRAQTGLRGDRGLLVDSVAADGPAEAAGIERYDVLISVNDHEVGESHPLDDAWGTRSPDPVSLKLLRGGHLLEFELTPQPAPESSPSPDDEPPLHGIRHPYLTQLGLDLKPISDTVRQQLPEPYTGGVEVTYVADEMPADIAGFKAGDVIVGLEKWEVRDLQDVLWVLNSKEGFDRFYIARGDESGREVLFGSMELAGIPGGTGIPGVHGSSPSLSGHSLEAWLEDVVRERRELIGDIAAIELAVIESRLSGVPNPDDMEAVRRVWNTHRDLLERKRAFEEELLVLDTKIAYLKRRVAELNSE
jgi:hypothetical protein